MVSGPVSFHHTDVDIAFYVETFKLLDKLNVQNPGLTAITKTCKDDSFVHLVL